MIDECIELLPGITHADVLSHEAWYRTYSTLLEKKKEAILRWKDQREVTLHKYNHRFLI